MITRDAAFPRCTDRAAWAGIPARCREEILAAGEVLAGDGGYPPLTASRFLAFARTGDRRAFEEPYFARRERLIRACLAYCVSGDEGYVPEAVDGLWALCEETGWWVSAHHLGPDPLPDADDPYIDLFAAQTAALVSLVCYLLEPLLPESVIRRAQREVERRVLTPFFRRDDFWWMGYTRRDLNNWTPWILANILVSGHVWGVNPDGRARMMLGRWLACVPEDGGLDEGVAYWNMAGASLLDCLEHLGETGRCADNKIRALAAFPLTAHIAGEYFLNFADCDAKPHLDGERLYMFGALTDNPALAALGADIERRAKSIFPADTPEFYRTLCRLFHPVEEVTAASAMDADTTLPDLEVWIRRRDGLYIAIKGGHNAESHNHNDIGSFILYMDGEPSIVDAGNMVYTAKTFRDETRYTLWNTRSRNHNVPLIGAYEQVAGREHAARAVWFGQDAAQMDIAAAYPAEAGVRSLIRTFSVRDGAALTDDIALDAALPVTWVFLLRNAPAIGGGVVRAGTLALEYDESALSAKVESVPIVDARMAKSFPGTLYRLTLTAPASTTHRAVFRMRKQAP